MSEWCLALPISPGPFLPLSSRSRFDPVDARERTVLSDLLLIADGSENITRSGRDACSVEVIEKFKCIKLEQFDHTYFLVGPS